jgi:hypothetical protein
MRRKTAVRRLAFPPQTLRLSWRQRLRHSRRNSWSRSSCSRRNLRLRTQSRHRPRRLKRLRRRPQRLPRLPQLPRPSQLQRPPLPARLPTHRA